MKLFSLVLALALPCLLSAQNTTVSPLAGTWKMTKAKWGQKGKPEAVKEEVYKIFTEDHFYFVYYDDNKFSGGGGGTYESGQNEFTEELAFFTWDSTATGTRQTFQWTIEGNVLHQKGKIMGTDEYDEYFVEEFYERVEEYVDDASPVSGVWQIEEATYGTSTRTAEESPWTARKVFTPKFWLGVFYNAETGSFNGLGFGTYVLTGNQYVEKIDAYSWDQSAVGTTNTFTLDVEDEKLVQKGKIDTEKYKDYIIEEHFVKVEK